ncbi:MAG TPA: hypothetical protein VGQ13_02280 [Nitrososphaera sp.]|nr:hypothetical protein [Nitrososphaera sp.]
MISDITIEETAGERFLVLQNQNGTSLSAPLKSEDMEVDIGNEAISKIRSILHLWGEKRKDIAEYYLKENRERDSFVYDLLALAHFTSRLHVDHDHLLRSWNATDLLHDRVVAQLLFEFEGIGYDVESKVSNSIGAKIHDFNASICRCEVKSLRIQVDAPFTLGGVWLERGSRDRIFTKLKQELHDAIKQAGRDGIVFMAPLSANLNTIFRGYFAEGILQYVPAPQAGTVVLVLSSRTPFKDCYVAFPMTDFLVNIEKALSDVQTFGVRRFSMFTRWPMRLTTAPIAGSAASFSARGN